MKDAPQRISTLYVWTNGDPSVGISGQGANVTSAGDALIDLDGVAIEDRFPMLEALRKGITDAFSEVWDEPAKMLFDFEVDGAAESKPPINWERCNDEKCVMHPRWTEDSGTGHWHQPHYGQHYSVQIDYEPIPKVAEDRLRYLMNALNDSELFEDHDRHKGQIEGYLASLRDTGVISTNHPLLVFFDCNRIGSV